MSICNQDSDMARTHAVAAVSVAPEPSKSGPAYVTDSPCCSSRLGSACMRVFIRDRSALARRFESDETHWRPEVPCLHLEVGVVRCGWRYQMDHAFCDGLRGRNSGGGAQR
ncbi:hypothetical protein EV126DRAFT_200267 [Verticillium dahliae]|nr:hypothetical protein EV126DRAFT_200267 [Verticillium dahliae]